MPSIQLTAETQNGTLEILGDKRPVDLPRNSGRHQFTFHLTDKTDLNVRFADEASMLDVEVGNNCPPRPGINSDQIVDVRRMSDRNAGFADRNRGEALTLCYALNFVTDDPKIVAQFDPEIRNGGGGIA